MEMEQTLDLRKGMILLSELALMVRWKMMQGGEVVVKLLIWDMNQDMKRAVQLQDQMVAVLHWASEAGKLSKKGNEIKEIDNKFSRR